MGETDAMRETIGSAVSTGQAASRGLPGCARDWGSFAAGSHFEKRPNFISGITMAGDYLESILCYLYSFLMFRSFSSLKPCLPRYYISVRSADICLISLFLSLPSLRTLTVTR